MRLLAGAVAAAAIAVPAVSEPAQQKPLTDQVGQLRSPATLTTLGQFRSDILKSLLGNSEEQRTAGAAAPYCTFTQAPNCGCTHNQSCGGSPASQS